MNRRTEEGYVQSRSSGARSADSSSTNAVSFSSARTMKRFPCRWRFVTKKQCNKLRGIRNYTGLNLARWTRISTVSNNRLSAPVSARSCQIKRVSRRQHRSRVGQGRGLANRPSPCGFADDQARAAVSSLSESGDTIQLAVSDFLPGPREMDNARWDRQRRS
jgi:hypothetical protein